MEGENNIGHPTLEKLKELKDKFANPAYKEDIFQIEAWETEVKDLLVRDELADKPSIKLILKRFYDEIDEVNALLLNSDSKLLSDIQRDRVLDKKKFYKEFLSLFDSTMIAKSIEAVDKEVDEELVNSRNVL